jgi:hypothetical protein
MKLSPRLRKRCENRHGNHFVDIGFEKFGLKLPEHTRDNVVILHGYMA